MNESVNTYASSNSRPSSGILFAAMFSAGSWLAISIGVTFGRHTMIPIYSDLGIALPWVTQFLIHPLAAIISGAAAVVSSVTMLAMTASHYKRFAGLSATAAILTGLVCICGFFLPFVGTIHSLD